MLRRVIHRVRRPGAGWQQVRPMGFDAQTPRSNMRDAAAMIMPRVPATERVMPEEHNRVQAYMDGNRVLRNDFGNLSGAAAGVSELDADLQARMQLDMLTGGVSCELFMLEIVKHPEFIVPTHNNALIANGLPVVNYGGTADDETVAEPVRAAAIFTSELRHMDATRAVTPSNTFAEKTFSRVPGIGIHTMIALNEENAGIKLGIAFDPHAGGTACFCYPPVVAALDKATRAVMLERSAFFSTLVDSTHDRVGVGSSSLLASLDVSGTNRLDVFQRVMQRTGWDAAVMHLPHAGGRGSGSQVANALDIGDPLGAVADGKVAFLENAAGDPLAVSGPAGDAWVLCFSHAALAQLHVYGGAGTALFESGTAMKVRECKGSEFLRTARSLGTCSGLVLNLGVRTGDTHNLSHVVQQCNKSNGLAWINELAVDTSGSLGIPLKLPWVELIIGPH